MGNVGTIKATINSAISLKRMGHEVKIYKTYKEWEGYEDLIWKEEIEIIDFGLSKKIKRLPRYGIGFRISMIIISILSFLKLVKNYSVDKPDIIIASLLGYLPLLARHFSWHKPIIINTIQGLPRFNIIRYLLWKKYYTKSDLIITLTNETRENLQKKFNFNEKQICVIPNPIIGDEIDVLSAEVIEDKLFSETVIVGMGRLSRQKDFETLIKAFDIVQKKLDCKLVILGEGEERENLESIIESRNLRNKVFLYGFVKNPYKYLNKARLFVLSSLWEDQGHALIEAAYLKKNIVSTRCPRGQEEFLEYGKAGTLCDISNFSDMADKILHVLENLGTEEICDKNISAFMNSQKFMINNHGVCLISKIIELRKLYETG